MVRSSAAVTMATLCRRRAIARIELRRTGANRPRSVMVFARRGTMAITCKKCPNGPFRLDGNNEMCFLIGECGDGYKNSTSGLCENESYCLKARIFCPESFRTCRNLINSYECGCETGSVWLEQEKRCQFIDKCEYLHMHAAYALVDQRASHNLLLLSTQVKREQEFIVELNIACKRKQLHTYKVHVFVV